MQCAMRQLPPYTPPSTKATYRAGGGESSLGWRIISLLVPAAAPLSTMRSSVLDTKPTSPQKESYDGVPVRVIAPRGKAPPQYMQTTGAKGRGRRNGLRRGGWLTENENIEKQKEFEKKRKKNKKGKKRRRKNRSNKK